MKFQIPIVSLFKVSGHRLLRMLLVPAGMLLAQTTTRAATVYAFWSAQDTQAPSVATPGSSSAAVTATSFLNSPPSITLAGTHVFGPGLLPGGATTFTAYDGSIWEGSPTPSANSLGYAFGWNGSTTAGSDSLTISLNMTNLADLALRMDIRSAQTSTGRPPAFSAIEYNIGSGFVTVPGADLGSFTNNNYSAFDLDLTSLSAIENVSDVKLRFTVSNTPTNTSFRMDNIQLSAEPIPEVSSWASLALASLVVASRRKRP